MGTRLAVLCLVTSALGLLPAAVASAEAPYLPGQLVVRFAPGADARERTQARAAAGAKVLDALPGTPRVQLLDLPAGVSVPEAQKRLERAPEVLYAEPNHRLRLDSVPNDPRFGEQWHLGRIEAPRAWDFAPAGRDVVAGVIDSGVEFRHPDLRDNIWRNPGESGSGREADGVDNDANGYVDDVRGWRWDYGPAYGDSNDPTDFGGHGTAVAGVLGAVGDNGLGGIGVSPRTQILPLAVYDKASYGVAEAIAYADRKGVRIVNGSFGIPYTQSIEDALAAAPDVLLIVSAGNEAWDADLHRDVRYPCTSAKPNVLCVAATDRGDNLAGFSNWGAETVDLAAPGVDLLTTSLPRRQLIYDDFEAPLDGQRWTTGGTGGAWGRTPPPKEFWFNSGWSLDDSPEGPYADDQDSWFGTAQGHDLTGHSGCFLSYHLATDLAAGDRLVVETRSGEGDWTPLVEHTRVTPNGRIRRSLAAFEGRPGLRFRFRLVTDAAGNGRGVHLDYIQIWCSEPPFRGDEYHFAGGTSNAAPQVTGTAALVLSRHPELTTAELRAAILDNVEPLPSLAGRTVTGGRLNTLRAVYGGVPPDPPEPSEEPTPDPTPEPTAEPTREPPVTVEPRPSPSATPTPRPADRRAPACAVRVDRARRRDVRLAVRCDERGRLSAQLKVGRTVVGRLSASISRDRRRVFRIRVTRRLPSRPAVRAVLTLTASDAAGNRRSQRQRLALLRR